MPEKLENKLTLGNTYSEARRIGFGRLSSAYLAFPDGIGNLTKKIRKQLFPVFEIDEEKKTYSIKSLGLFGNTIAESYGEHLEIKGYRRI